MKFLLTIALALSFGFTYGQKCSYEKNEVDKFTKNKVVITKEKLLYMEMMANGFTVQGKNINDAKYLSFTIILTNVFSISQGNKIMFLLKGSDEVVEIESLDTSVSNAAMGLWTLKLDYIII